MFSAFKTWAANLWAAVLGVVTTEAVIAEARRILVSIYVAAKANGTLTFAPAGPFPNLPGVDALPPMEKAVVRELVGVLPVATEAAVTKAGGSALLVKILIDVARLIIAARLNTPAPATNP